MTRPIRLRRLLKRHDQPVMALQQFCDANDLWVRVFDEKGQPILDVGRAPEEGDGETNTPVLADGQVIGSVEGTAAAFAAPWLSAVATDAHLNRAIGAEVLQLYRQQRVMASLAELLSDTSEPDVVADIVVDSVARALDGSGVGFIDDAGRVLAASGAGGVFDRDLKPTEPVVDNQVEQCMLAAPVVGAERRYGHLQAVRPEPDFTAAEAELFGTLGVIAASAIGRARAHERDLAVERKRSHELEEAVERLQSELEMVTNTVLASVLFTDLVDSTKSQASVGDAGWAKLIAAHNQIATDLVDEYGGTLVDFAGDGFFAWFETPSSALDCGRRHLTMIEEIGLKARAGIHVGEAQQRGNALSGLTVNTAARIMAKGGAGQLLVSGITAELLHDTGHTFEWVGEFELKGLPAPRPIHALVRH